MSMVSAEFCGMNLATSSNVSSLSCSSKVDSVNFARSKGCILRSGGTVSKTITVENFMKLPKTSTRSDVERLMNELNEWLAGKKGTLNVYGVSIENCVPVSVKYGDKIVNDFFMFDITFEITEQKHKQYPVQGLSFYEGRRQSSFLASNIKNANTFVFMQNCDMLRNVDFSIVRKTKPYDSDFYVEQNGGVENVSVDCWLSIDNGFSGRKNCLSYMMNMINSDVGEIGTFTLGSNTISNCAITGINMKSMSFNTMEYSLALIASLQC